MDPDWHRRDHLLAEALEQPSAVRAAFLDRACAGDAALRAALEGLLAAAEQEDDFLDAPAVEVAGGLVAAWAEERGDGPAAPALLAGRRVGAYRLLEKLDEGGMGTVYLAERADGHFEQRVALKLVRAGVASDETRRRFRQERQILARLNHPHIARLLDGGVMEGPAGEEQPWLVMELVAGEPITAYCDRHRLPTAARLGLFAQMGEAVQYAHRSLVIHRDLKPGNVLVAEEANGTPCVKLLDFGIARLLEGERVETRTLLPGLTPEYAAPEQVRGEPVTTATDVYSLGVVLYELLTGHRPYGFARLTPGEIERVVCEQEPERPSTVVARTATRRLADGTTETRTPAAVSRERASEPEGLRRRLRGDLDTIVLKALRKEPAARYATVDALLEDLRRHLAGLPVLAHPATPAYRLRLFTRRHRWSVAAAAAFALLLLGSSVVTAVQARRIAAERDRARSEAAKAGRVTEFLLSLFEANDPAVARGDTLTAGALMARGLREAEALRHQPDVQAQMLEVIGRTYTSMDRRDLARAPLARALALQRRLHPEPHPDLARSLYLTAVLSSDLGDYGRAEPLFREALAMRRRLLGPDHPDVGAALFGLAGMLHFRGRPAEADTLFGEALRIFRQLPATPDPEAIDALMDMARYLEYRRSYADAEALYRRALPMQRAYYGTGHPRVAETLAGLASVLLGAHRYSESEQLYRQALDVIVPQLGASHRSVQQAQLSLARALYWQGRYAEAERLQRQALDAVSHQNRVLRATLLLDLGWGLREQGRLDEAAPLTQEALRLRKEEFGVEAVPVAEALVSLGRLERLRKDYEAAAAYLTQARAICAASLRPDHPAQSAPLRELGYVKVETGAFAEAEPLLRHALAIQGQDPYVNPYQRAEAQRLLGVALTRLGRYGEAEGLLRASLRTAEEAERPTQVEQARRALRDLGAARRRAAG